MNRKIMYLFIIAIISILTAEVDYNSEIQPIFNESCSGCHIGGSSAGMDLSNYDGVMNTGNHAPVVIPGDHLNSLLYQKVSGTQTTGNVMPPNGPGLSESEINLIATWIDEGALENVNTPTSTVFMTELTDPQNSSDAGRYVELYNNGGSDVELGDGWALQRWTNGNVDPQSPVMLAGTIAAGGFYIICNDADKFNAFYGLTCDQDIGTGGAADSNGDDNIALVDPSGSIVDMFGVAGEDGSGTGHEFEDGRAERVAGVTQGNSVWDVAEWNIDNDSGGGDGNQYAPEGFDPAAWIGTGDISSCDDENACNYGELADCEYVNVNWGNLQWPLSSSVIAGTASENIYGQVYVDGVTGSANPESGVTAELGFGESGTSADDTWTWTAATVNGSEGNNDEYFAQLNISEAGSYSYTYRYSYDSSCWYYASEMGTIDVLAPETSAVTFNVDMTYQDVSADGVGVFGLFSWSDGFLLTDDDGDGVYSGTVDLPLGDYLYKFKNGNSWENIDELDCSVFDDPDGDGFGYWDRGVSVTGDDISIDTDCFGACGACLGGCMDSNATNYNPEANVDDGSCDYPQVDADNIFFSEYGEGSGYNKYLEIYNGSEEEVDLSGYQRVNCSNGCTEWEYYSNFADGAVIAPGDVYVICDTGVGDDFPSAECDESGSMYFNGDDAQGIYHTASASTIDVIGAIGDDPGSGWEVAGVSNGTKDHSLVRDASVTTGNADWVSSSGTGTDDSEWLVFDQNTWTYIGSHPHDFAAICDDDSACNYGLEGDCEYATDGFDCDGNALINITFEVDMSEQVVDTEGYGLDLFLDSPYGYHDMFDDDGDGVWSVTLTLLANSDYAYKFKNGDEWEGNFDELGCGAGDTYGNRVLTTGDSDMTVGPFCFNSCTDCEVEVTCGTGDPNFDGAINVTDIVNIVNHVLAIASMDEEGECAADMNGDSLVNVTDIVIIVNIILDGRLVYADEISLLKTNHGLLLEADNQVGAVQLRLKHGDNFSYQINENSMVSKAVTRDNITTFISVLPEGGIIISTNDDFEIIDVIAANEHGEIAVNILRDYKLVSNYPNPFNPVTVVSYIVEMDNQIKLQIFDLNGRLVKSLINEFYTSGTYSTSWHGDDNYGNQVGSGLYLLVYESKGEISTQKITLLR